MIISGTNFGSDRNGSSVTIGTLNCNITSIQDSLILCTVGPGEGKNLLLTIDAGNVEINSTYSFQRMLFLVY